MLAAGEKEFGAEMKTIGRTHNRNLVQLTGFYIEGFGEFMIKGSPSDLFFEAKMHPKWNKRALREPLREEISDPRRRIKRI